MIAQKKSVAPDALTMQELIDDIKSNHHDYMIREMQKMRYMLRELAEFYADVDHRTIELLKIFEHFTRDFIEHMDTEETQLFPWILSQMGPSQTVTTVEIDKSTLEQLNIEDSSVDKQFALILSITKSLSSGHEKLARDYKCAHERLCLIQENLTVHMKKEHDFILPLIEHKLSLSARDRDR